MAYTFLKRTLDVFLSGIALIGISPILLLTTVILKLTGDGDIFFGQERLGRNKKPFVLFKFVTMQRGSEIVSSVTSPDDPRVLPVGRILRKAKINELPQLINVFVGDMSIVGFRPLVEESFDLYDEGTKACLLQMKPGLAGIGSIVFRDEEELLRRSPKEKMRFYEDDIIPLKGALELWYFKNRSFVLDLKIIVATTFAIIASKSTFYIGWFDLNEVLENSTLGREILD